MYTYLNQKYGLKQLIIEQASSIITAVRTYVKEDQDVMVFAKILKNECDEDFRFKQSHLKTLYLQALKQVLREKQPFKSEKEIVRDMKKIRDGCLEEWMWQSLICKVNPRNIDA
jgi:hypothetical protein